MAVPGFGFSPSDIALGIRTCIWLRENCFNKTKTADVRYNQFANDVSFLENRLSHLKNAFETTLNNYEDPEFDSLELRSDLKAMVGDFQYTLDQCTEILEKNIKLSHNSASLFDNIIWGAGTQNKVDELRRSIQFHCQKIFLIVEPVNHQTLRRVEVGVYEVLEILRAQFNIENPLPDIPVWLDEKFCEMILQCPPTGFTDKKQIPLKEGFDAAYSHFRAGTYAFRDAETSPQTAEQYLNLWKSQWILRTLREGDKFRQSSLDSLFRRAIVKMERRILKEHERAERGEIARFDDNALKQLNTAAFLIWPVQQIKPDKIPTDRNEGEQMLLKLSIPSASGNDNENLVIFRTGLTTMRVVRKLIDRIGTISYENERFNVHSDKLIPLYTISGNSLASRNPQTTEWRSTSTVYSSNGMGGSAYEINGELAMLNFQRAFTGYQVVFDASVGWTLHSSGNLPSGYGKLQIWHWKPLTEDKTTTVDPASSSDSYTTLIGAQLSQVSTTTDAVLGKVLHGRDVKMISVDEKTETESVIHATTTPFPVLMIFTKDAGGYNYHQLELDFGFQIVEESCQCRKQPENCRISVIEKHQGKGGELPFSVQKLSVKTEQLSEWNLCLFSQPRHPSFNNEKHLPRMKCRYLRLEFNSVADRKVFGDRFNHALFLRDRAERNHQSIIDRTQFLAEKNGDPSRGKKPKPWRRPSASGSIATTRSLPEGASFLAPLARFSSLNINNSANQIFGGSSPNLNPGADGR